MNSLFVSNPATCYGRPFHRTIRNVKEVRRVSFLALRSPRCAMDLSVGGEDLPYNSVVKFPRMHMRDPYKLLGVTPDVSEEEIRGARNFLLQQYAGHERSVEAIELAYEKIIMKSFRERKKAKMNLKSKLRNKVDESPSFKKLLSSVEVPKIDLILRRLFLFGFMAVWSVMYSAQTGPAFQVFLALLSCIFFLNDKMKDVKRACFTGFGALVVGWVVGATIVPLVPAYIFPPTWSLELLTSFVAYVFLFLACTFLK
ncbi:cell growth defect factor-like protein (DUF3353) [Carex rostrata]